MTESNNFFELVEWLKKNVDWLNLILIGGENDSALIDGVVKPSIDKRFFDRFAAIQAMVQGRSAFETKAELDAAGAPPADKPLAEVWNDPTLNNNGLYGYSGGVWVKSPYDMQQLYTQTSAYLSSRVGADSLRDWHHNLMGDASNRYPGVFWGSELPQEIINGKACLVFGGGSTSWSTYSRALPVDLFPSGLVSASLKIEQLGSRKDIGATDRILLIQYSTDAPDSANETAREEVTYSDSDQSGTGIYITFDNVAIHPDTKSIYLYLSPRKWDIYVSEVCVADGPASAYRQPVNAFFDKNVLPKGSINPDYADSMSLVDSWEFDGNHLQLNAKVREIAFIDYDTPAQGELTPGSEVFLSLDMKAAKTSQCDVSLFQYDTNETVIRRTDLSYTGSGGEWVSRNSGVVKIKEGAETIRFRVVNRSEFDPDEPEGIVTTEFKNVTLYKIGQSAKSPDPYNVMVAVNDRAKKVEEKVKEVEALAKEKPVYQSIDNLIKEPVNFSGFSSSDSPSLVKAQGNTHILLSPASGNDRVSTFRVPYHHLNSGLVSCGVTLSRKLPDTYSGRVMLLQYDSNSVEVAREYYNFAGSLSVDENDPSTWVDVVISGIALLDNTRAVSLYLDSGSNHTTGFYFTNPWMSDGVATSRPQLKDFPNYWFDADWTGNHLSALPQDTAGFKHLDSSGPMLVIQDDDDITYARRYWVDAVGVFTPQNHGYFECTMLADDKTGNPSGAEMGILFFDSNGDEIARKTIKNTKLNLWHRVGTDFDVPTDTARVQIRFVRWGNISTDVRFRDVTITDAQVGHHNRSFYVSSVLSNPSSSAGRTVYISPNGNDTNSGTETSPFKTLTKAVSELNSVGTVIVLDGTYGKESISVGNDGNLVIRPHGISRPKWIQGHKYEGVWAPTIDRVNIWQIDTTVAPNKFIFEHLTPEGLISDADRLPIQRGRTHRLPSFRLKPFNSLDELDAGTPGGWLYDSGQEVLYITTPNGDDPNNHDYYRPDAALISGGQKTAHLQVDGIESWYGPINFNGLGSYLARDIRVIGSRSDGIRRNGAKGIEYHIEAAAADNDGANAHNSNSEIPGLPSGDVPPASHVASFDMWCHDNWDDGDSLHERCEGEYHGGLWEWNGDRGVATAYGAHVSVYSGVARDNGNNGQSSGDSSTSGEGFGSLGTAALEEGGVGTQMICFSCESYRNNVNYSAYGDKCTLTVNQSISRDARVAGYASVGPGSKLIAKNCFDSGSAVAKLEENGGSVEVINAGLLT
ncbi:DUF1565 domain-containing protein [Vibrio parahaemolyticus]|uniref:DUF1565 domain-containing protein n=1 Tax=Vibrio parahaemolyticus TaxID=670 RepID=UPI00235E5088|nr:DUF1565 domain-containing protein [Vibrio parahaemolyticus]